MIVLIVAALLASRAGLGGSLPQETYAATSAASTGEPSVERAPGAPVDHEGVRRTVFLRATAPAISRVQPASGTAGTDGPRTTAALGAELLRLELATRHATGQGFDVGHGHVPMPQQPAVSPRAPPTA